MKLIEWKLNDEIEAYTTCKDDDGKIFDLSFNGSLDNKIVLKNRIKLANYLNTDLEHMIATYQKHTSNFLKVSAADGGKGMYTRDDAFY